MIYFSLNFERDEESGIPLHAGCPSRDLSERGGERERGKKSDREKESGPWSSLGILKLQHA